MAEIIFQTKLESEKFYQHLLHYLSNDQDHESILLIEDRHKVNILDSGLSEELLQTALYDFITQVKRDDWFREILQNQYLYRDLEEQQQILDIIESILEGERADVAVFLKDTEEVTTAIQSAIEQILQENVSFSFDSLLKFRFRPYLQVLEGYVELALDEYKMEQEYQMFIQMLRDFLLNRESKVDTLHVLFDEEITFYNEQLVEIKRAELIKMIDRKLLVNHPVYVDSASIAPLLSLAPTSIYIYTKDRDAPLIRTISNIFEERVMIRPFTVLHELKKWNEENHA